MLVGLTGAFVTNVQQDDRVPDEVAVQIETATVAGVDFVASAEVEAALVAAGLDPATTQAVVDDYEQAQLRSLKAGLLAAALIALVSLAFTRDLPSGVAAAEEELAQRATAA